MSGFCLRNLRSEGLNVDPNHTGRGYNQNLGLFVPKSFVHNHDIIHIPTRAQRHPDMYDGEPTA